MASNKRAINGWINLHKPLNMSSAQAVGAVKRLLRPAKIGHAGTLDPLADGVLPLALGEATKTVNYMMDARKTYQFTIHWGEARSTDDAEGDIIETSAHTPSKADVQQILSNFIGKIEQVPPAFSAIKQSGKRAYELARAGEKVTLKAREVEIYSLVIASQAKQSYAPSDDRVGSDELPCNDDTMMFSVECSKGTYIRSLARDMARALGTVGYVSRLRRLAVGSFALEDTISLDFLEDFVHKAANASVKDASWLCPVDTALADIPALQLELSQAEALRHGRAIPLTQASIPPDVQAAYHQQKLVAIVESSGGMLTPKRVFNL